MTVKKDCFAYSKETGKCKALEYLYCRDGNCTFYKTPDVRCKECKNIGGHLLNCKDCHAQGIY